MSDGTETLKMSFLSIPKLAKANIQNVVFKYSKTRKSEHSKCRNSKYSKSPNWGQIYNILNSVTILFLLPPFLPFVHTVCITKKICNAQKEINTAKKMLQI